MSQIFKDEGNVHEIYTEELPDNLKDFRDLMVNNKVPKSSKYKTVVLDRTFMAYNIASTLPLTMFLFLSLYWLNNFTVNIKTNPTVNITLAVTFYCLLSFVTFRFFRGFEHSNRGIRYNKLIENKTSFLQANPQFDKLLAIYALEPDKYKHLNNVYMEEYFKYFDKLEELKRENFEFKLFQQRLDALNDELEVQSLKDKYNL